MLEIATLVTQLKTDTWEKVDVIAKRLGPLGRLLEVMKRVLGDGSTLEHLFKPTFL